MKKCFLLVVCFALLMMSGTALPYSYTSVPCNCGSSLTDQKVSVELSLTNFGGMNIFYFASDDEQLILNLYGNVTSKRVTVLGNTDGSGQMSIEVSGNYGTGYSVSFVGCSAVVEKPNSQIVSFIVGSFMALAFAAASVYKWGM